MGAVPSVSGRAPILRTAAGGGQPLNRGTPRGVLECLGGHAHEGGRGNMQEKLNTQSIQGWLTNHPGWSRKSNALTKEYRFTSFRDSIVFVNRIAGLADVADH